MLFAIIFTLCIVFGCASDPVTPEQHKTIAMKCGDNYICIMELENEILEDIKYERAAALAEYQDTFRNTYKACQRLINKTMVLDYHCGKRKMEKCIPKHRSDGFACKNQGDILR